MRVLIVKVSSLGDIIHTLPAVTDAKRANRRLVFDWVVEENFVEVPAWHPAVDRVIPVALRRWRKNLMKTFRSGEFKSFKHELKLEHYDLIIDAQGLIKSGIISRLAKGLTVGLSNSTIKEPLATLFYNKMYSVPKDEHAVQRVRELFSRALNYPLHQEDLERIDYGLDLKRIGIDAAEHQAGSLIFLHGTTWDTKHWPQSYWRELARLATAQGYTVSLPWGNLREKERAHSIAKGIEGVSVLPQQNLTGMARHIAAADAVVGVDTGLCHLAAALDTPTLTLFGPTNSGLSGTFGHYQERLSSQFACSPCMAKKCSYEGEPVFVEFLDRKAVIEPPCFSSNPPSKVLQHMQELIAKKQRSVALS
ncbi:MAG: lipopolysaccharide heptosyltransferase I [Pseudohongiellaceae bacterium]|nr:lipopolysaccharide heptosyltransferase I [Pseudohongiellaceae bacterium]